MFHDSVPDPRPAFVGEEHQQERSVQATTKGFDLSSTKGVIKFKRCLIHPFQKVKHGVLAFVGVLHQQTCALG
jgi:hypothetical protein